MGADFAVCTVNDFQDYPAVEFADGLFYVFWIDRRYYFIDESFAIFGARITPDGQVIDPDGKEIFCDSTADCVDVAYGVADLFVVSRNRC
ncbi:MAG: hypothetical protein JSU64_09140 [candidate division WOR-3 bacterium]|nr:MAG: hypothetical protein JSU64_09140 [candidate division WOR-3 bacterium]